MSCEITWSGAEENESYDWCGTYKGKYVDVTNGVEGWSFYFNGFRIASGFISRYHAIEALEEYLENRESIYKTL